MFYSYDLEIAANTEKTSPVKLSCLLSPGTIDRVMVVFPTGSAKLAHLRIMAGSHQLWPTNVDGDFSADGEVLDYGEDFELTSTPFELQLIGWNDDDTYAHTITVRFNVIREIAPTTQSLTALVKNAFGLQGR